MDALPVLLDTPPAYIENLDKHNDCYVTRVAYDLGSTATKVRVARVNICTKTIEEVISDHTYPVAFFEDVAQSEQLSLSDWIQSLALQTLQTAKMQAEVDILKTPTLINPRTEHCAIATQAFRIAENGAEAAAKISAQWGIPIQMISQESEGKLSYLSVLSHWQALHRQLPVVWDIGSARSQLIFQNEVGEFYMTGSPMAARSFQKSVQHNVIGDIAENSPHPMTRAQIQMALRMAEKSLRQDSPDYKMIHTRIKNQAPLVGIGKVHNKCALAWVQKCCDKSQQGYSKADLLKVMDTLANKTDQEIQALAPSIPVDYIPNQITNIILIAAMMEVIGIDWVEVLDVNNTSGLLLSGCH